ncbi:MAG: sulfurtransferase TusA family protein [Deltaproteobacteria bacterium]|nr:sulfurtransferase TusA family protein [Deltaproteobacteria bacterium]
MFKLPNEVITALKNYSESLTEYLSGRISSDRFKGIRVPFGFYSQRASRQLMGRVRIPAGSITSEQLKAIADTAKKFNLKLHITDRQDIQLHGVSYEDTIKVLDYLKDYNLSTIGGGGNTVRNVAACYLSGICKDEVFDVRKYAVNITEYLLKDPVSTRLPRKFKVSFSGCYTDCAYALVNDVGLLAKEKDGAKGFRVYCGGGMGASSAIGQMLEDFIPLEKTGYVVKAVMLAYNKHGDRLNRHRNRLRFLIQDMGFERFKTLYQNELNALIEAEYAGLRDIRFKDDLKKLEPVDLEKFETLEEGFRDFIKYNLISQKQDGYYAVELDVPQGDMDVLAAEELAGLGALIPDIEFRTTQNQNLLLCNIDGSALPALYKRLQTIFNGNAFIGSNNLTGVIACKGATTCNLGLCNSPALARAMVKEFGADRLDMEALKGFRIKSSVCPNNCGQHVLGVIGLQGMTRKVGAKPVPLYKILAGGRIGEDSTRFAQEVGVVPARNVPKFLKEYFRTVQDKVNNYDTVHEFLEKEGVKLMKDLLNSYSYCPDYNEDASFYKDWERDEDFSLAGIGPGECGAGVLDLIDSDLAEAEKSLNLAKTLLGTDLKSVPNYLKDALIYSARALQVVKGLEPKEDKDVIESFINGFIDKGIAESRFRSIMDIYNKLAGEAVQDELAKIYGSVNEFYGHIKNLYKQMDPHFRFPSEVGGGAKTEKEPVKPVAAGKVLNLKGVACPINYVKAKLFLETLDAGTIVAIYLDEGEPIRNVPSSLKGDGHEIIEMEKEPDGHYRLVVRNKG